MTNLTFRKIAALIVCIAMIFSCFTGFTSTRGFGDIYVDGEKEIYKNTTYREIIGEHAKNGIEHAYVVESDIDRNGLEVIVFNGEVRGTYTVGSMIDYAESQGYKVIAAINGDVYDTASGTPQGTVIHSGNIVTSGYMPDRVLCFDNNGNGSIEKVGLKYTAKGTLEYQFSEETQTQVEVPVETVITITQSAIDENGVEYVYETTESSIEYVLQDKTETIVTTSEEAVELNIDFFNVPHGGANGLHLYNSHYAGTTKTSGSCAEVVIETNDIQLEVNKTIKGIIKSVNSGTSNTTISGNTLVLSTVKGSETYDKVSCLKVGSEIEINVENALNNGLDDAKEAIGFFYSLVENGKNVTNGTNLNPRTAIGIKRDGTIVFLEVDGRNTNHSKGLNLVDLADMLIDMGCETAVNMDGGGSSVLYVRQPGKDSKASLVSVPSEGSQRRISNIILLAYKDKNEAATVKNVHIYPAHTIIMPGASATFNAYASNSEYEKVGKADGAKFSVSSSYGTVDSTGVFKASNKTGTTEITASYGGDTDSSTVLITDDIIIKPSAENIVIEAGETRDLSVSAGYGTEKVNVPVITADNLFTWSCDDNIGTIDENGLFTAIAKNVQEGKIYVSYGNVTKEISVKVGATIAVFSDTVDHWAKEQIGILTSMGYLSGMGENKFEPDGNLTRAQFVTMLSKITSQSEISEPEAEAPSTEQTESNDSTEIAEPTESPNTTEPTDTTESTDAIESEVPEWLGNVTAEMTLKSAKTSAEGDSLAKVMNFSDVPENEWYYEYVKWGYENGIVNGMGDGTFAPNSPISREQMAVMLCNYAAAIGFQLPQNVEIPAFTDYDAISPWALDYVLTVAGAGIINGFDTGEFLPQGVATRAQAAKVMYVFCQLKGIL